MESLTEELNAVANSALEQKAQTDAVVSAVCFENTTDLMTDAVEDMQVITPGWDNRNADSMTIRSGDLSEMTGTTVLDENKSLAELGFRVYEHVEFIVDGVSHMYQLINNTPGTSGATQFDYEKTLKEFTDFVTQDIGADKVFISVNENGNFCVRSKDGSTVGMQTYRSRESLTLKKWTNSFSFDSAVITLGDGTSVEIFPDPPTVEFKNQSGTPPTEAETVYFHRTKLPDNLSVNDIFGIETVNFTVEYDDTPQSVCAKLNASDLITADINDTGHMTVTSNRDEGLIFSGSFAQKIGFQDKEYQEKGLRPSYARRFNTLLEQIDALAADSTYKGVNLLNGNDLTVVFNETRTSSLEIKGVTFDSQGLGVMRTDGKWQNDADILTALEQVKKARSLLRTQSEIFGRNLSTLTIRKDFTQETVETLQSGKDKLVLADVNEESANILSVQTRQQLAVNALSMGNQSAQSVLNLF